MAILPKNIPLTLGHKLTVSILAQKFEVPIRGWYTSKYIITEAPLVNGDPIRLAPNTGCEVHFIKEGEYFTFKTHVMCISVNVVALMIIDFPRTVDSYSLRKNKRLKISSPVELSYTVANKAFNDYGIIRDLSLTGALITHKKELQKGNKVVLNSKLSSGDLSGQEAVVKNIRHNPKSETEAYVTGVNFPKVTDENKAIIQGFLEGVMGIEQQKS